MKLFRSSIFLAGLLMHCVVLFSQQQPADTTAVKKNLADTVIKYDDTRKTAWPLHFEIVEIISAKDNAIQKAYFHKTKSAVPQPLIVSLHTWSGNYTQKDEMATLCQQKDLNYIHPDFRGENKTTSACCSDLALADIDDAIGFAIKNANVDSTRIYVIGVSGGGYATLSVFMKSKRRIKKFSAWASITNLEAWYTESSILKNKYAPDILACTGSTNELNIKNARERSPQFMKTPLQKLQQSQVFIYAGIYDGIQGSVPITHAINFYNKVLADLGVKDQAKYVSDGEKLRLLENRQPLGSFGTIANRKICLQKQYGNIKLTIFEGNHEMLADYALNEILKD